MYDCYVAILDSAFTAVTPLSPDTLTPLLPSSRHSTADDDATSSVSSTPLPSAHVLTPGAPVRSPVATPAGGGGALLPDYQQWWLNGYLWCVSDALRFLRHELALPITNVICVSLQAHLQDMAKLSVNESNERVTSSTAAYGPGRDTGSWQACKIMRRIRSRNLVFE